MNKSLQIFKILILLTAFITFGCSLEDSRDECCESLVIDFRYSKGERCILKEKMSSMNVYLFDHDEILIWERKVTGDEMDLMKLDLEDGRYSLVSIGNSGNPICVNATPGQSRLSDITLEINGASLSGDKDDINRIYYGYLDFTAEKGRDLRYICDMSNHYCRLSVAVKWKNGSPSLSSPYTLRLSNVSGRYSSIIPYHNISVANFESRTSGIGRSTDLRVTHNFCQPCPALKVAHSKNLTLYNNELFTNFLTIRYREDQMPYLKLTNGASEITSEIDLGDFFRRVGWQVDENIEQTYSIILEIDANTNQVIVWPGKATTSDWEDGGII